MVTALCQEICLLVSILEEKSIKESHCFRTSVKFYFKLLRHIQIDSVDILKKHNPQKVFYDFSKAEKGIILCSDVEVRSLDMPSVDWIVQYDPPSEPNEYIHRFEGSKGKALLFLIPQELKFLHYFKAAKISIKEYEFDDKKMETVQSCLEKLIKNNYHLNKSAKDAYRSYDLQAVAVSFCFSCPPKINLSTASKSRTQE